MGFSSSVNGRQPGDLILLLLSLFFLKLLHYLVGKASAAKIVYILILMDCIKDILHIHADGLIHKYNLRNHNKFSHIRIKIFTAINST